jgi:hypothetical protein
MTEPLSEQRKFVLWWDRQEKSREGSPQPKANRVADRKRDYATLSDVGLDRLTVHRWRTRLKNEKKYEAALND